MSLSPTIPSPGTVSTALDRAASTFAPKSLQEAFLFAEMILDSGMAPKSYLEIYTKGGSTDESFKKAQGAIVVALQYGMEVGFQPMQALQCIANINGMPSIWGDGALGLVRSSGQLDSITEDNFEDIKKNEKATCTVYRKGDKNPTTVVFSYADAKAAGIFTNAVWKTYPYRMCQMRARAFALRDKFPDVLKGLHIAEEVQDYNTIDAPPAPKIAPTVALPTAAVTAAAVTTAAPAAPAAEAQNTTQAEAKDAEAFVTIDESRAFYDLGKKNGYTLDMVKEFLAGYEVADSRKIKNKDYKKFMDWVSVPASTRQ